MFEVYIYIHIYFKVFFIFVHEHKIKRNEKTANNFSNKFYLFIFPLFSKKSRMYTFSDFFS